MVMKVEFLISHLLEDVNQLLSNMVNLDRLLEINNDMETQLRDLKKSLEFNEIEILERDLKLLKGVETHFSNRDERVNMFLLDLKENLSNLTNIYNLVRKEKIDIKDVKKYLDNNLMVIRNKIEILNKSKDDLLHIVDSMNHVDLGDGVKGDLIAKKNLLHKYGAPVSEWEKLKIIVEGKEVCVMDFFIGDGYDDLIAILERENGLFEKYYWKSSYYGEALGPFFLRSTSIRTNFSLFWNKIIAISKEYRFDDISDLFVELRKVLKPETFSLIDINKFLDLIDVWIATVNLAYNEEQYHILSFSNLLDFLRFKYVQDNLDVLWKDIKEMLFLHRHYKSEDFFSNFQTFLSNDKVYSNIDLVWSDNMRLVEKISIDDLAFFYGEYVGRIIGSSIFISDFRNSWSKLVEVMLTVDDVVGLISKTLPNFLFEFDRSRILNRESYNSLMDFFVLLSEKEISFFKLNRVVENKFIKSNINLVLGDIVNLVSRIKFTDIESSFIFFMSMQYYQERFSKETFQEICGIILDIDKGLNRKYVSIELYKTALPLFLNNLSFDILKLPEVIREVGLKLAEFSCKCKNNPSSVFQYAWSRVLSDSYFKNSFSIEFMDRMNIYLIELDNRAGNSSATLFYNLNNIIRISYLDGNFSDDLFLKYSSEFASFLHVSGTGDFVSDNSIADSFFVLLDFVDLKNWDLLISFIPKVVRGTRQRVESLINFKNVRGYSKELKNMVLYLMMYMPNDFFRIIDNVKWLEIFDMNYKNVFKNFELIGEPLTLYADDYNLIYDYVVVRDEKGSKLEQNYYYICSIIGEKPNSGVKKIEKEQSKIAKFLQLNNKRDNDVKRYEKSLKKVTDIFAKKLVVLFNKKIHHDVSSYLDSELGVKVKDYNLIDSSFMTTFSMYKDAEQNKGLIKDILVKYVEKETYPYKKYPEGYPFDLNSNKLFINKIFGRIKVGERGKIWFSPNEKVIDVSKIDKKTFDFDKKISHHFSISNKILQRYGINISNVDDLIEFFDGLPEAGNQLKNIDYRDLKIQVKSIKLYTNPEKLSRIENLNKIKIYHELNPLRIMMMGEWVVGSCLSLNGGNYWSAASNVVDANKAVFYAEDMKGNILGRLLVGIKNDGSLIRFISYNNGSGIDLDVFFEMYLKELAEKCGLKFSNNSSNFTGELCCEEWYDDGIIDWMYLD